MSTELNLWNTLISFGTLAGLAIPLIRLFYMQGKKDQRQDETERNINGIGKKVADIRDQQAQVLTSLNTQITNVNITMAALTESIKYIEKTVEELKPRRKVQ